MRHLLVLCAVLACVPRIAAADEPIGRLFYTPAQRAALPAQRRLQEGLEQIRLAAKKYNVKWLGGGPPGSTPEQEIDQGRRMGPAGANAEAATRRDREYTKRKMPV